MRLSTQTSALLPENVARPDYDRAAQECGIVHFGIGAFHRAHQAIYTDDAMNAGDRNWGIRGVSLRSAAVAKQLNPQDGLYTVTARAGDSETMRLIGAVQNVIVAQEHAERVIADLASSATSIASFTVTEKGYCRRPDGNLDHASAARSFYPFLASGLRRRKDAGLGGLTLLSCDNLTRNGDQLQRLMSEYLAACAPALQAWFERECTCPSTMVDRIVPAMTDGNRDAVETAIGVRDEAAIITEPFSQWVIEDKFAAPRPRWEAGGALFTNDVQAYEAAKLRMLNGAHSALAYIGLAHGHDYVHQAIGDPLIRPLIDQLIRREAAPSLSAASGQDLDDYANRIIARFANPAIHHRLVQIAMDGSQKIPQRWLETLTYHQARNRTCPAILTALAAWIAHLRQQGDQVDDPMASELSALVKLQNPHSVIAALFGEHGLFRAHWQASTQDISFLAREI